MRHRYTAYDRYRDRVVAYKFSDFVRDVQEIYTGSMTYERLAFKYGILSHDRKPVKQIAFTLARELVEIVVVPRRDLLEDYEDEIRAARGRLQEQSDELEDLKRQRENVIALRPDPRET